jgi:excisionase family DNA binding protein
VAAEDWDYRDVSWVAQRLGLDQASVVELLSSGKLPGVEMGNTWLISEGGLKDFLHREEQRQLESRRGHRSSGLTTETPVIEAPVRTARVGARGVTYALFGKAEAAPSWIALLVRVLQDFSRRDPNFLTRFSELGGRARRYVATAQASLYPGRPDLVRYSKRLENGWWLATNFSASEIQNILKKACDVAGVRWGVDLVVRPGRSPTSRKQALQFVGIAADSATDVAKRHDHYFVETLANGGS